jgi:uncharacterized Fe-S center protein
MVLGTDYRDVEVNLSSANLQNRNRHADADSIISMNHTLKGMELTGFGGALKNLGMVLQLA